MRALPSVLAALTLAFAGCSDPPVPPPLDASTDAAADDVTGTDDVTDDVTATADVTDDVTLTDASDAGAEDVPVVSPPFSEVQALFTRSCAMPACHGRAADGGGGGSGGLYLTDGVTSYRAMVDQPSDQVSALRLVAPGDPENSYLMIKVEGRMRNYPQCATSPGRNPCGVQMPQLAAPLNTAERTLLRDWIRAGAPMM